MRLAWLLFACLAGCGDDAATTPDGDSDSDSDTDTGTGSDTVDPCDVDGDGHDTLDCGGDDCDDEDPDAYPDAPDAFGDDVDQNCDRTDGVDVDGDGFASVASGGDDCDDGHDDINPGVIEAGEWDIVTAVSEGDAGTYTTLALDADGLAHVAYYDTEDQHLGYATNASGAWVTEVADCGGICEGYYTAGWNASLALGSDGAAYISYDKWWPRADDPEHVAIYIHVTTNATGAWEREPIDPTGTGWFGLSLHTSLAIDTREGAGDVAHVSFYEANEGVLKHATNESGDWVIDLVDAGEAVGDEVGLYSSLAIDADGAIHIAYHDQTRGDLEYATNQSGAWVTERIDEAGDTGVYASLALDGAGGVHIAHHNRTTGDLLYTSNATGDWITDIVDSNGTVGAYPSIAVDADGAAHASYFDASHGDLKYATNAGGRWVPQTVDSEGTTGTYTSIKVGADGLPHVAYYDATNGVLRYAIASPDGIDQNCDGVSW